MVNINLFFGFLIVLLLGIFFFFKPIRVSPPKHTDIAQLELKNFTVYDIESWGVKSALSGARGERFDDRYEVSKVAFSDASKPQLQRMSAEHGHYENNIVDLNDSVIFEQEDGITFRSQEAHYDLNRSLVTTQGDFIITMEQSKFEGTQLAFNTKTRRMHAIKINALFDLEQQP